MRTPRVKEINVILKSNHHVQRRIGLVYPNSYSVGMSGFTIKLLYHLLNRHPNIYTESSSSLSRIKKELITI